MRQFIVWIGLCASLLCACDSSIHESSQPPNVLLILVDDLGWSDVGFHGSDAVTPRIDALRGESIEYTRFYAFPTCSPSRAALLTGRTPMELDMVRGPVHPWALRSLPADVPTLAELLSAVGYRTALVGKWHLGLRDRESWPNRRGFDHFYGLLGGAADYFDRRRMGGLDWQRNGVSIDEKGYTTDLLAQEAIRLIQEQGADQPLFLYLSMTAAHTPLAAPNKLERQFSHIANADRRKYLAVVAGLDRAVGQVLDALENSPLADNTLVVFVSDNGAAAEHGGSNAPFRGSKATTFEGGLRVPAMIRRPGGVHAGGSSDRQAWLPDLFVTLTEAAGVPRPPGTSGQSLLTTPHDTTPRRFFFSHQSGTATWLSMIEGRYKGVWRFNWSDPSDRFELLTCLKTPVRGTISPTVTRF